MQKQINWERVFMSLHDTVYILFAILFMGIFLPVWTPFTFGIFLITLICTGCFMNSALACYRFYKKRVRKWNIVETGDKYILTFKKIKKPKKEWYQE